MDALARRAWRGVVTFDLVLALFIFIPAWTVRFWQAWVYWSVFAACVFGTTLWFLRHDRALVERRMNVGPTAEQERSQQYIQAITSVLLLGMYIVAGLDHHGRWSTPLDWTTEAAGDALFVVGFGVIFFALRENSHAAATVRVEAGQRVVSTGPYGVVRHPLYSGALLLFLSTPLGLGSWWAFLPALALSGAVVARLLDEERYLSEHLPGYPNYCRTVTYRLIPRIW